MMSTAMVTVTPEALHLADVASGKALAMVPLDHEDSLGLEWTP